MRRALVSILIVAASVLASAPAALAGIAKVAVSSGQLRVIAASKSADAPNTITVTKEASTYTITEQSAGATLDRGAQCAYSSPPSHTSVTCQGSAVASIFVDVRDGSNVVRTVGDTPSEVHSGSGADYLTGGDGIDKLYGGDGMDGLRSGKSDYDELYGEGGDDFLEFDFGGPDNDGGRLGTGKIYDGGPGLDQWAGFSARVKPPGTARIDLREWNSPPRPDWERFTDDSGLGWGLANTAGPYFDASGGSEPEAHALRNLESVFGTDGDDRFWGHFQQRDESFYGLGGSDLFNTSPGSDRYICGHSGIRPNAPDGRDTVDYSPADEKVTITLDGQANDGRPGENDTTFNDCDIFHSGSGGLTVHGNDGSNSIELLPKDPPGTSPLPYPLEAYGHGGNDTLRGNDVGDLSGDGGNDTLSNGRYLWGGLDNDILIDGALLAGGPNDDTMLGGPRGNYFFELPGEGTDIFLAGLPEFGIPFGGPDAYLTRDGVREIVACGSRDYVLRFVNDPVNPGDDTFAVGQPQWGDADDDYRDCF